MVVVVSQAGPRAVEGARLGPVLQAALQGQRRPRELIRKGLWTGRCGGLQQRRRGGAMHSHATRASMIGGLVERRCQLHFVVSGRCVEEMWGEEWLFP